MAAVELQRMIEADEGIKESKNGVETKQQNSFLFSFPLSIKTLKNCKFIKISP